MLNVGESVVEGKFAPSICYLAIQVDSRYLRYQERFVVQNSSNSFGPTEEFQLYDIDSCIYLAAIYLSHGFKQQVRLFKQ